MVLAGAGVGSTIVGIAVHGVWRELPAERLLLSLVVAGLVALAAWPLRRWCRWRAATAFAAVWLSLLTLFGVVNVPIILFSVVWWNTLHQGSSIGVTHAPRMARLDQNYANVCGQWPPRLTMSDFSSVRISSSLLARSC
jgi:predicted PurR-regulated permease PerM